MVNGNYILYGDRPSSESEIVDDHVHAKTAERKSRRKSHRTAHDQSTLNINQLENDTDSLKYEKRVKEPKLLRYVPTTDVEENYVTDKYESYDLKPTEERPKKYAFTKKPRNPADGSVNYAYSRSSSSCSSPNGNLPTISEHAEQYGTYRVRPALAQDDVLVTGYESKLDKYFAKPREVRKFAAKGSHPDSLYRVPAGGSVGAGKIARALRLLRWPAALVFVCVALAVFVYFLMPEHMDVDVEPVNGTYWDPVAASIGAQTQRGLFNAGTKPPFSRNNNTLANTQGTKTPEIDFYEADTAKTPDVTVYTIPSIESTTKRKLPIAPVYPDHITPEVQYGNEKADSDKLRNPKNMEESNAVAVDSTLKPHITQKPEKPLAISIKDGITTSTETISKAETFNDLKNYGEKFSQKKSQEPTFKLQPPYYAAPTLLASQFNKGKPPPVYEKESEFPPEIMEFYHRRRPSNLENSFTSGHSKFFGISIEDAEKMKSTTQSSTYNTRVSPTLPTWRDNDSTTKNYPVNVNADVPQCRSTRLAFCRGVLPYDLAGPPVTLNGVEVTQLLPQVEYLVATNCSERITQFMCALLEPECSPPPYPPKMPCYNLCKAITDSCDGMIPRSLAGAFKCSRYSSSNCVSARGPCGAREFRCGDGSCIPRDWICDGASDCPASEDEEKCVSCGRSEFRCQTGGCIQRRWLCDGYSDCPHGDDESSDVCEAYGVKATSSSVVTAASAGPEPGEDTAGSAPAPAVRRPHRMPSSDHKTGEYDSSKELLITSDSSNALRKNFTRRPSLARLTPYNRPMLQDTRPKTTDSPKAPKYSQLDRKTKPRGGKAETTEDVDDDDLGIFDNIEKEGEVKKTSESQASLQKNENPRHDPEAVITHLDKSINKLEKILDGASLLRKAVQQQEMQDSPESNNTMVEKETSYVSPSYDKALGGVGSVASTGGLGPRASPCPSGELRCVDGRCITLAQLCDGTIDCTDHADEDNCYT